ncbi:MAG: hypothetical protein ABEI31_02510 [Halodesulfurarchaeum sp.]
MLLTGSLSVLYEFPTITPFTLPGYVWDVQLVPLVVPGVPNPFETWLRDILGAGVYFALWVLYYLGLLAFISGIAIAVAGIGSTQWSDLLRARARLLPLRRMLVVGALVAGGAILVSQPTIRDAFLEGGVAVTLGVGVALGFFQLAWTVYLRATSQLLVFILYPLIVGAFLFPVVAVAAILPWLSPHFHALSRALAGFLLDTVLGVGDLDGLLRARFDLTGENAILVWVGIDIGVGWLLGLAHLAVRYAQEEFL